MFGIRVQRIDHSSKWRAYSREGLDKNTHMRHRGRHINYFSVSVSTHAIDVYKASIMPQNCCVPDCTKKVDVESREKTFLPSLLQMFDIFWTKVYFLCILSYYHFNWSMAVKIGTSILVDTSRKADKVWGHPWKPRGVFSSTLKKYPWVTEDECEGLSLSHTCFTGNTLLAFWLTSAKTSHSRQEL